MTTQDLKMMTMTKKMLKMKDRVCDGVVIFHDGIFVIVVLLVLLLFLLVFLALVSILRTIVIWRPQVANPGG